MKQALTLIFLIQTLILQAQFQKQITIYPNTLKSTENHIINPDFEFSSIAVSTTAENNFTNTFIIANQDTFPLQINEDYLNDSIIFSNLIVFKQNMKQIEFYTKNRAIKFSFHFLNAHSTTMKPLNTSETVLEECFLKPRSISQEEWREGLPTPDYERIVHQVNNLIIHHSAGSNTDTCYTNVIRNIYLYHTQTLKWSDIGYNYVIAQNGQLYDGRDPGTNEQDNVKGAHFCSSNAGTMGVCLLGNYEEAHPTDTSLITLSKLLAWKAVKDNINPYSVFSHPLNASLNYISGHRDGCATLCPGENLYKAIPSITNRVDSLLVTQYSDIETSPPHDKQPPFIVNYKNKTIRITNSQATLITIIDYTGKPQLHCNTHYINYSMLKSGIYFIGIKNDTHINMHKLMLY